MLVCLKELLVYTESSSNVLCGGRLRQRVFSPSNRGNTLLPFCYTVGPLYLRVAHPPIQPTVDRKYSEEKFQNIPKSKD